MIQPNNKKLLLLALKKAKGSINTIEKMIDEEKYCLDIAQQINATLGLLRNANSLILKNHLQTCGRSKLSSKDDKVRNEFIDELMRAFGLTSRK